MFPWSQINPSLLISQSAAVPAFLLMPPLKLVSPALGPLSSRTWNQRAMTNDSERHIAGSHTRCFGVLMADRYTHERMAKSSNVGRSRWGYYFIDTVAYQSGVGKVYNAPKYVHICTYMSIDIRLWTRRQKTLSSEYWYTVTATRIHGHVYMDTHTGAVERSGCENASLERRKIPRKSTQSKYVFIEADRKLDFTSHCGYWIIPWIYELFPA